MTYSRGLGNTRAQLSFLRELSPERLVRVLDDFHRGELAAAAQLWDAMERRDDLLQGVAAKRKKSVARLGWDVLTMEHSDEALAHKRALEYFYNHMEATHACDENERGGFSLLVKQMMDAVGKRYAVHEIVYEAREDRSGAFPQGFLTAQFRFVPLWYFENKSGHLRFLGADRRREGRALEDGSWLVTTGDGLMESCSIAYIFKHLPLRDWLVYCERNGMPGVKGITDAAPGTVEWESACEAVRAFGADFSALMSRGTDIQPIDLSTRGELPYPALVDRMDRAMAALWRGSDLATLSRSDATGASIQGDESALLEEDDAHHVSETLNAQVDRAVLRALFHTETPKAYIRLKTHPRRDLHADVRLFKELWQMGVPLPLLNLQEHFGLTPPAADEAVLPAGGALPLHPGRVADPAPTLAGSTDAPASADPARAAANGGV